MWAEKWVTNEASIPPFITGVLLHLCQTVLTCSLSIFEKKEELFPERGHCTSIQVTVITGSVQNLNGSMWRMGTVSLRLLSWQVTLNRTAQASDIPPQSSKFCCKCLKHLGKVLKCVCISTNLNVFSGRVCHQTHLSPFHLTALSGAREVWQGEVRLL